MRLANKYGRIIRHRKVKVFRGSTVHPTQRLGPEEKVTYNGKPCFEPPRGTSACLSRSTPIASKTENATNDNDKKISDQNDGNDQRDDDQSNDSENDENCKVRSAHAED